MQQHKSVKWILNQFKNKEDVERFKLAMGEEAYNLIIRKKITVPTIHKDDVTQVFYGLYSFEQEKIIRTALSRIDGKAVLSGLEGNFTTWFNGNAKFGQSPYITQDSNLPKPENYKYYEEGNKDRK